MKERKRESRKKVFEKRRINRKKQEEKLIERYINMYIVYEIILFN